jgi:hypothetical protein
LNIPLEGKYGISISADSLPPGEKTRFLIDNKNIEIALNNSDTSKLIFLGTIELTAGLHNFTVDVPSPEIRFSDNFTGGNNYMWQPMSGEWVRENGTLRQLKYLDNAWNIVKGLDLSSFAMNFNMEPDYPNLYGNGMIFHYTNGSTYALQLNEMSKTVELWYWNGSDWRRLASSSADVQLQHWHSIKVVVQNNNIKILMNESEIMDFFDQDTSHNTHGAVGLDGGFGASFDNVTIMDTSGEIVSQDNFDSSFQWSSFFGDWEIVDGWMSSGDAEDSYLMLNSNFADSMLDLKMVIRDQDENNYAYPGVVFRVQDPYNYYGVFLRRSPTDNMPALELWKRINGTWTYIAGTDLPKVELNTTYDLKIIMLGWKIKVFLNDDQVIPTIGWQELTGHELSCGGIGLRSRYTDVRFDNVTVTDVPLLVNNLFFIKGLDQNPGTESPQVTFQKSNPTKYVANIKSVTKPFFLVFVETYDDGWKAFINGKEQIPDEYHFVANGFANVWYVDQIGNFTVDLEYTPQGLYEIGLVASAPVIVLLLVLVSLPEGISKKTVDSLRRLHRS